MTTIHAAYRVRPSASGKSFSVIQVRTGQAIRYGIRNRAEADREAAAQNAAYVAPPEPHAIIGKTVDQRDAIATAVTYMCDEHRHTVVATGIVEWYDGEFAIRLSSLTAVIVHWNGHDWEVTQDLTLAAYDEMANTPATCAYCMTVTTVGQLTVNVCPTCHRQGIEA